MTEQTTYSIYQEQTQEDVNSLAKQVFANGKLVKVHHNGYSTNNPEQIQHALGQEDKDMVFVKTGNVCYEVVSEILPVKFFVHTQGTAIIEIIEVITR